MPGGSCGIRCFLSWFRRSAAISVSTSRSIASWIRPAVAFSYCLSKVFRRRAKAPMFDLRHLGVQVLGFAPTVATRDLKAKVGRCIKKLAEREIVSHAEPKRSSCARPIDPCRSASTGVAILTDDGGTARCPDRSNRRSSSPCGQSAWMTGAISRLLDRYPTTSNSENGSTSRWRPKNGSVQDSSRGARPRFSSTMSGMPAPAPGRRPTGGKSFVVPSGVAGGDRVSRQPEKSPAGDRQEGDGAALPDALTEAMRVQFEAAGQPADVARRNAERFCGGILSEPLAWRKTIRSSGFCGCWHSGQCRDPTVQSSLFLLKKAVFLCFQVLFGSVLWRVTAECRFAEKSRANPRRWRPTRRHCDATDTFAVQCDATDTHCRQKAATRPTRVPASVDRVIHRPDSSHWRGAEHQCAELPQAISIRQSRCVVSSQVVW